MTDKDFKFDKPIKPNKNIWVLRVIIIILAIAVLCISLTGICKGLTVFFDSNTLRFYQPIKVQARWPMEVVSREQIKKEEELNQKVEEITDKCMEVLKPTATPVPKVKSGLIKQVEATDNVWHYLDYSDRPYYDKIIAGLKVRYTNWQEAAELIAHEGMFQPEVLNPTFGACGLPQALPCSKMKCSLDESGIDCQLDWMKAYVASRYGTITNALAFRMFKGWY